MTTPSIRETSRRDVHRRVRRRMGGDSHCDLEDDDAPASASFRRQLLLTPRPEAQLLPRASRAALLSLSPDYSAPSPTEGSAAEGVLDPVRRASNAPQVASEDGWATEGPRLGLHVALKVQMVTSCVVETVLGIKGARSLSHAFTRETDQARRSAPSRQLARHKHHGPVHASLQPRGLENGRTRVASANNSSKYRSRQYASVPTDTRSFAPYLCRRSSHTSASASPRAALAPAIDSELLTTEITVSEGFTQVLDRNMRVASVDSDNGAARQRRRQRSTTQPIPIGHSLEQSSTALSSDEECPMRNSTQNNSDCVGSLACSATPDDANKCLQQQDVPMISSSDRRRQRRRERQNRAVPGPVFSTASVRATSSTVGPHPEVEAVPVEAPRAAPAAASAPCPPTRQFPLFPGTGKLVAVVDDSRCIVRQRMKALSDMGYHSAGFEDGADLLAYLARRDPATGRMALRVGASSMFSLILMDNDMPRLSGAPTCRLLRSMGLSTPIVAISASFGQRESYLEAGANGFVCKPVRPQRIFELAKEFSRLNHSNEEVGAAATAPATEPKLWVPAASACVPAPLSDLMVWVSSPKCSRPTRSRLALQQQPL